MDHAGSGGSISSIDNPVAGAGAQAVGAGGLAAGAGGVAAASDALTVHVEDVRKLKIEIITLTCAGDCADVQAVAVGGNPPYAFTWDDGSTEAARRFCLDASKKLRVSARDTSIQAPEFGYEAQTANAELTASVLGCTDAGMPPTPPAPPAEFCVKNPSLEGTAGLNVAGLDLPDWTECTPTPDVNPGRSAAPASEGATYFGGFDAFEQETAGGMFCSPLVPGRSVSFLVDLRSGSGLPLPAPAPVMLEIWGGMTRCAQDELLWKSTAIANSDAWKTYCGTFSAGKSFPYLMLVPKVMNEADGFGYLHVDNFRPATSCP